MYVPKEVAEAMAEIFEMGLSEQRQMGETERKKKQQAEFVS
jgi:hypothetical protein